MVRALGFNPWYERELGSLSPALRWVMSTSPTGERDTGGSQEELLGRTADKQVDRARGSGRN